MAAIPQNIDDYLEGVQPDQKDALNKLRRTISRLVPEAIETIISRIPAFRYKGKYLVSFRATKHHLSFFMMRGKAIEELSDQLQDFDVSSKVIRFTVEKPLPGELIRQFLVYRRKEIDGGES